MADDPNAPTPQAAATPADGAPATGDGGAATGDGDTAPLGDAGKKALDAMKQQRNAARDTARPWTELGDELGMTPEQIRAALKPAEPDAAQVARDVQRTALAAANQRILRAEIRAAAASRLQDPADALAHLDLQKFTVGEDGEVDAAEIGDALDDLLTRKPYLAKADGPRGPRPDPSQGARPGDAPSLDQQIAEAERTGDWNTSRRLKQQKLAGATN